MKEIEQSMTDGWMIIPPEHTPKARRWIEAAEDMPEPANPSGEAPNGPKGQNKERVKL